MPLQFQNISFIQQQFITQMQAHAQRYEAFMKFASSGVFIMDMQGNLKECSQMAADMLGYSMEEMITLNVTQWEAMVPPEEIAKLFQSTSTQTPIHFESKHKRKDGTFYDAAISSVQIRIGGETFIYASVKDITEQKEKEMHLKNLLEQQKALYKVQTIGFIFLKNRYFEWTNETFEQLFGYEIGELQGQSARIIYDSDDQFENYGREGYEALKKIGTFTKEIQGVKKDGTKITLLTSMTALKEDASEAVGVAFNITEMKQQTEIIKKQNQEFKTIFEISRDGLAILDLQSNFLDCNDAYLTMTGLSKEELLASSCIALSIPQDHQRSIEAMKIVKEQGYLESFEKTCIVKDGKQIVIRMALSLMPDKKRILTSAKDVTDLRNHERELEFIAHFDPLTKLPNRVLLSDRMQQSISNAHRNDQALAVAYLDLDGFKQVNDTYGHEAGDLLLVKLSERMQGVLRAGDTLARIGGDEFVVVLNNQGSENETFAVLNRLLNAAASNVDIGNAIVAVSASIGVTFYIKAYGVDADILLRQADQAMYEAKMRGKNQIALFQDLTHISDKTGERAQAIKNALEMSEFIVHYQPKVNMKSGEVVGVEALIRWNSPQQGIIYPDDFLPIVDNRPLMNEIDKWVFNEALKQLSTWANEGLDIKISINISAYTFKQKNFISIIDEIIAAYPTPKPFSIDIEILESNSLHDIQEVQKIIEQLHTRNITVSLDDFGTGYSTLSYLKQLGIDTLKIDKSFILDILHNKGDLSIINASVGLAEAFQVKPLAEGVESIEQGNILLKHGCYLAQGYIISRPMSAELLPQWIKEYKAPNSWTH